GLTVELIGGAPDILGTLTSVGTEHRTITTTFDLTGAVPGPRDLVITNPDGNAVTLSKAFNIQPGGAAELSVDIIAPQIISVGSHSSPRTFIVLVANTGNTDAVGMLVSLFGIPAEATLTPLFQISQPPQLPGEPLINFGQVPIIPMIG